MRMAGVRRYVLWLALLAGFWAAGDGRAVAQFGGGLAPGQHGDTDLPFGTTDTTDQGWPGYGGPGGSSAKVDAYGKKNWPCYPAGQWSGSKDFHPPKDCPQNGGSDQNMAK